MSTSPSLCRLCITTTSNDLQSLYDEDGLANSLYEMTYEYFHPKIVDMEKATHLTVICLQCFRHLQDFYSFQSLVKMAQLKLPEEKVKTIYTIAEEIQTPQGKILTQTMAIKIEKEEWNECPTQINENDYETLLGWQAENNTATEPQTIQEDRNSNVDTATGLTQVVSRNQSENDQRSKKKYQTLEDLLVKCMPNIKCVKCPKTFPSWRLLKEHFKRQHPSDILYFTCCSRQFTRYAIKDHLRLHIDPDAFKCEVCGKRYTSSNNLANHKADIHPERFKYSCSICAKRCSSETGLGAHYRDMHNTDRQDRPKIELLSDGRTAYTCPLCGQIQYTSAAFRTHISKRHSPNSSNQVCIICRKNCRNEREFREHMASHQNKKLYKCAFCPRTYMTMVGVTGHRRKQHPLETNENCYINISENTVDDSESEEVEPSTSASTPFAGNLAGPSCTGSKADNQCDTEKHISVPKLEIMDINSDTEIVSEDEEIPLADFRQSDKNCHTSEVDVSSQDSRNIVDADNARPGLHDLLKKWLPKIKCAFCPVSYTKLTSLENHFRQMHSNEQFYVTCCARQFRSRDRLRDHLMIHNDPNAYKCKFCGKCYHSNANLNVHLNQKHSESHHKFACKMCGKRFHLKKGLASHMKLIHKKVT